MTKRAIWLTEGEENSLLTKRLYLRRPGGIEREEKHFPFAYHARYGLKHKTETSA